MLRSPTVGNSRRIIGRVLINARQDAVRPKPDSRKCTLIFSKAAVLLTVYALTRMFMSARRSFLESG
jgi:hypothetical protein